MNNFNYNRCVKNNTPKEEKFKNSFIAFLSGGLVGLLGEFLTNIYIIFFHISSKTASTFTLVTIITISCLFTAIGFFDDLVNFCKCGLIIPISGFAHSVQSAALEHKKEGFILGIGSNIFKLAGSVILYGVVSAWFFATIRLIIGV